MGSKTFEGVRFSAFSEDHLPPHIHGASSGVVVIIDLLLDGEVRLSRRVDAITPRNAQRNIVAKILRVAEANKDELKRLWEAVHGNRS